MSRVKIPKIEIWEDNLPAVCMICGVKPGQTKSQSTATHVFFPLSLLGIAGKYLSPKKVPFSIVTCGDCKHGYNNEASMTTLFGTLYSLVWVFLLITWATQFDKMPKALLGPAIAAIIVIILHGVYYFTTGKKYAIRCVAMDGGTVSFEFPGGMWGVAYTTHKREAGDRRLGRGGPPAGSAVAQGAPSADQGAAPPGAPVINHEPIDRTPEPKSGGGGLAMEGDDSGRIPSDLTGFLSSVKEGDTDKVETLLDQGGDVAESLPNGMNGLHIAAVAGMMQMADLLIRRGINVNSAMTNGLTAMHLAVQSNNQSIVGLLLAKKGNPNAKNTEGRTPLHWCAAVRDDRLDSNNRFKMAQLLFKGGGDVTAVDKNGKTAGDLAEEGGEGKVAQMLG